MSKTMDYIANGGDDLDREKAAHEYTQGILGSVLDENDTLRALLTRYRNETPLGHQPHMIAHEVDAALGLKR